MKKHVAKATTHPLHCKDHSPHAIPTRPGCPAPAPGVWNKVPTLSEGELRERATGGEIQVLDWLVRRAVARAMHWTLAPNWCERDWAEEVRGIASVENALKADFLFEMGHQEIKWDGYKEDPQAFFKGLNDGKSAMACTLLTRLLFETGNMFGNDSIVAGAAPTWAEGRRDYDRIWIPGDWGCIKNLACTSGRIRLCKTKP